MHDNIITLPHDDMAEQIVLGSLLLEPDESWPIIEGLLTENNFFRDKHKTIFNASQRLYYDGKAADIVGVRIFLEENNDLNKIGGFLYLSDLLDSVITSASLKHYADIVKKKSGIRDLIKAGRKITEFGLHGNGDLEEARDKALDVFNKAVLSEGKDEIQPVAELTQPFLDDLEALRRGGVVGLTTGYKELDHYIMDLKGQLVIVAGSPSAGKSMFMINMLRRQASKGIRVGIVSMEMTKELIYRRLIQAEGRLSKDKIQYGSMENIRKAAMKVAQQPIFVSASGSTNMSGVLRQMRQLILRDKAECIYIDYLQLISGLDTNNRSEELGIIMRGLLSFAQKYEKGIVAGAQINREAMKQGTDKRPHLWQLRSSGEIENTADIVLGLYRPDYADREVESGLMEVHFMKHRSGQQNTMIEMACNLEHQRIDTLAREY